MRIRWVSSLALLAAPLICAQSQPQPATTGPAALLGYSVAGSERQDEWEKQFRGGISTDHIRENMRRLSAHPHHVGSPYDRDNAEWILARFTEWGFDAKIETFNVLFPTPKDRLLEMLKPTVFRAQLREPPVPGDPTSSQSAEQLPTYNAYSADGDVTAPLVYVNYGNREDYEQLDRLGISVKGAIVIARYGHGWRGVKPKVAAEHGAIGCIIYSDPREGGYFSGDEYPAGGWRPKEGVQRGSVMDTDYPGDPLTPGVGATAEAKRLALKDAKTITAIPVLPISYADALPLLASLKGPMAPESWRGALALTYHLGPGPALVHLKVASNWDIKPIYDVIATLHGSKDEGEWVLRGNHHDARVTGAEDPISGQAAMLEEARMLASCTPTAGRRRAPSSTAHVTGKSLDCSARSNGLRLTSASCRHMRWHTSIPTATGAVSCCPAAPRIFRLSSAAWPVRFRIRKHSCRCMSARICTASQRPRTPKRAASCANAPIWK